MRSDPDYPFLDTFKKVTNPGREVRILDSLKSISQKPSKSWILDDFSRWECCQSIRWPPYRRSKYFHIVPRWGINTGTFREGTEKLSKITFFLKFKKMEMEKKVILDKAPLKFSDSPQVVTPVQSWVEPVSFAARRSADRYATPPSRKTFQNHGFWRFLGDRFPDIEYPDAPSQIRELFECI